jgi:hypothetical protein
MTGIRSRVPLHDHDRVRAMQGRGLSLFRRSDAVREIAALTGLLALLAQLTLAAVYCRQYASDPISSPWLGAAICHVRLDQHRAPGGKTDEPPQPGGKSPACPVCLAIHACGASILPTLLGVALVLATRLLTGSRPITTQVTQGATVVAYSRGPPLPA